MIKIKKATDADTEVLALLGRITWAESHGDYIVDKNSLLNYLNENFSVATTKQNINNAKNLYYIIYVDDFPVGYSKLVVNANQENIASKKPCRLERIYILNEFIALKIGQQLLTFVEAQAKALQIDTIWLTVYIKNNRAIKFYKKNKFNNVGKLNYVVSKKSYENTIFSKTI